MSRGHTTVVLEEPRKVTRALLVGVEHLGGAEDDDINELLSELAELTRTLGVGVGGRLAVRIRKPSSRYLVGQGKAEEICEKAASCGADVIIFDDSLTPSQQRNWEKFANLAVIDRQEVILDIFGSRAHTREAELQVALARAHYDLPRLKRRWTHLSRQRGGMGLRGEGEQQIEVDARLVKKRISRLQTQLKEVRKQRSVQRSKRLRKPVPLAALVGYTNAGKSSLLNALTDADVLTEDKLFATLDPTVRRLTLPNRQDLLLTDTVGFIRNLPHLLVEAFKATLEETVLADFLLEVIDVTGQQLDEHHRTTREVLAELGAAKKPVITVFNKVDLVDDPLLVRRLRRKHTDAVFVSAKSGEGLEDLRQALTEELERSLQSMSLLFPHSRYDLLAKLHRTSRVISERHTDEGIEVEASVPGRIATEMTAFLVPGE